MNQSAPAKLNPALDSISDLCSCHYYVENGSFEFHGTWFETLNQDGIWMVFIFKRESILHGPQAMLAAAPWFGLIDRWCCSSTCC